MSDVDTTASTTQTVPQANIEVNLSKLGYYLDGWSDLIEGMGSKAPEVQQAMVEGLQKRKINNVKVTRIDGFVSIMLGDRRKYILSSLAPEMRTTIYIVQQGDDLYTSWKSFYTPTLNNTTLMILALVAGFFGIVVIATWEWLGFLGWIVPTILAFLMGLGLVGQAGKMIKGNPTAFLVNEANLFDAEDITAMNLAVHKTLIRSLDEKGIDITKLRLKQDFKGGRRDENV